MASLQRLLPNICTDLLRETALFYGELFDFKRVFESDWFIQLQSTTGTIELGIMKRDHELVPSDYQGAPNGFYLTLVVEELTSIYEKVQQKGYDIVQEPEDTFYGQRRMLIKDPAGSLVDVSAPIPGFQF